MPTDHLMNHHAPQSRCDLANYTTKIQNFFMQNYQTDIYFTNTHGCPS